MTVREEQLLKALSDMEGIAKGSDVSPGMTGKGNDTPKTTSQANGGLSGEGDQGELAVSAKSPAFSAKSEAGEDEEFDFDAFEDEGVAKATKGKKKKTLSEWAKEEEAEDAHKGDYGDDDESEDESEGSEDEDDMEKCKTRKAKKSQSIADLMKSDSASGAVIDVSPFIETLVDQVSDSDAEVKKALIGLGKQQGSQQRVMKALGNLMLDINKKLETIVEAPAGIRKSVMNAADMEEVERFPQTPQYDVSKQDVLDTMINMVKGGQLDPIHVTRYEMTDTMEPEIRKSVEDNLLKKSA